MTGDPVLDLLVSLAGVGLLVGLSWLLGGWRSAALNEATAAERLSFDEPDFEPVEWIVDVDERAAAAANAAGDAAVAFRIGDKLATRRFPAAVARTLVEECDGRLIFRLKDHTLGKIEIRPENAQRAASWAQLVGVSRIVDAGEGDTGAMEAT